MSDIQLLDKRSHCLRIKRSYLFTRILVECYDKKKVIIQPEEREVYCKIEKHDNREVPTIQSDENRLHVRSVLHNKIII